MFRLILTATALMAAGSAMASSIEVISGPRAGNNSVTTVSCEACPPLKEVRKQIYNVPVLEEGLQKVEIRDVGEEKQLVRTEKWFGGSPVVRVSSAKTWMPDETGMIVAVRPSTNAAGDGIDHTTTTAAVGSEQKNLPVITDAPSSAAANMIGTPPVRPDFADFSLRTN